MVEILTCNGKMKATTESSGKRFFDFAIPAFEFKGFKTCPQAGMCRAYCYARQGAYTFSNTKRSQGKKLELTQNKNFVATFCHEVAIKLKTAKRLGKELFIRYDSSGDIYSLAYLNNLIEIANTFPDVSFYTYSKMVSLIKSVTLPKNFTVIFSFGGLQDNLIDKATDKHAVVFISLDELNKASYVDCSHSDYTAWLPTSLKVGIVYHGVKKSPKRTH